MTRRLLFALLAFALVAGPSFVSAQAVCAAPQAVCDCCPDAAKTDACNMCGTRPDNRTEPTLQPAASGVPVIAAAPVLFIARLHDARATHLSSPHVPISKRYLAGCNLRL